MLVVPIVVALMVGLVYYGQWDTYLRVRFGGPFGITEPLFGRDVALLAFRLPFYELLQNSASGVRPGKPIAFSSPPLARAPP